MNMVCAKVGQIQKKSSVDKIVEYYEVEKVGKTSHLYTIIGLVSQYHQHSYSNHLKDQKFVPAS